MCFRHNLPPANLNLFVILFILYLQNKIGSNLGTSLKGAFTSCSLINLDFLLLETAQFEESIILPFFVPSALGSLLSVFYLLFKQQHKNVLK